MNDYILNLYNKIKQSVLGRNNENIDFIIDSFYKLPPQQRIVAISAGFAVLSFFVVFISYLYFAKINEFDKKLNTSWMSYNDFKRRDSEYKGVAKKLNNIINKVSSKVGSLKLKPFFEKISNDQGVQYRSLDVHQVERDDTDAIYQKIKEYEVDIRLSKISIPKLMKFMLYVEKANKMVKVKDLKISGLYGDKLYFDASIAFKAFMTY